jgi:hypothetical protein
MKQFTIVSLISYVIAANASNINTNTPSPTNNLKNPPTTSVYYGADGKYAGTIQSVNGGTSYYKNGQYQGQAPTGSNIYYNQQGTPQIINSPRN